MILVASNSATLNKIKKMHFPELDTTRKPGADHSNCSVSLKHFMCSEISFNFQSSLSDWQISLSWSIKPQRSINSLNEKKQSGCETRARSSPKQSRVMKNIGGRRCWNTGARASMAWTKHQKTKHHHHVSPEQEQRGQTSRRRLQTQPGDHRGGWWGGSSTEPQTSWTSAELQVSGLQQPDDAGQETVL